MAPAHDVFGLVGTTIVGAFQVEEVVAEGGFAVVYRAHHVGFRAPVALKCLKIPQYFSEEEQQHFQEQFQAEAELLFKLSASIPHVVRPLHVEAVTAPDGSFMPFMALEWLEGQTIDAYARDVRALGSPLAMSDLALMLTPVARALEKAHKFVGTDGRISIVHRDMKPENIFIARVAGEEIVKVLDFGIAKARSMATEVATHSTDDANHESFSPAYGAPEQWLPKQFGHTGPWTDVWGLALTFVEVAAGRPIMKGDHKAMLSAVTDPVRRPTPRNEGIDVDDEVEDVFRRALAVDPKDRYGDAGAFWDDLLMALGLDPNEGRPSQSGSYHAVWVSVARTALASSSGSGTGSSRELIPDLEVSPSRRPSRGGMDLRNLAAAAPESSGLELDIDDEGPRSRRAASGDIALPRLEPAHHSDPAPPASGVMPAASARVPRGTASAKSRAAADASSEDRADRAPELARPLREIGEPPSILRRFAPPVAMIVGGMLITAMDMAYAASAGQVLYIGPLRPAWVAAALVLGGIGLLVYRLLPQED